MLFRIKWKFIIIEFRLILQLFCSKERYQNCLQFKYSHIPRSTQVKDDIYQGFWNEFFFVRYTSIHAAKYQNICFVLPIKMRRQIWVDLPSGKSGQFDKPSTSSLQNNKNFFLKKNIWSSDFMRRQKKHFRKRLGGLCYLFV